MMDHKLICDILNSEMELATGCTEPAAIALCAANARAHLKGEVAQLTVLASVNIIKMRWRRAFPEPAIPASTTLQRWALWAQGRAAAAGGRRGQRRGAPQGD